MCEENNNACVILYNERIGGGDDTEGNIPNGIVVTLSYWMATSNWITPNHYLLHKKVMINRDVCVDEVEVIRNVGYGYQGQAEMIRKAIEKMDKTKRSYKNILSEAIS